jgi:hypothetical protein
MPIRGGSFPPLHMDLAPSRRMEPPPWSLALDAHYCIMVRLLLTHRIQVRECATTANYFSFPPQKRNFGYRLDNTEILSSGFGAVSNHHLLEELRVGDETLADLSSKTRRKKHGKFFKASVAAPRAWSG